MRSTFTKEPWEKPSSYNGYPNLFKILKMNGIQFEIVGTKSRDLPDSSRVVKTHHPKKEKMLINYFIGDISHLP